MWQMCQRCCYGGVCWKRIRAHIECDSLCGVSFAIAVVVVVVVAFVVVVVWLVESERLCFHMLGCRILQSGGEQLLCCISNAFVVRIALPPPSLRGSSLEHRSRPVEDKHRQHADEEQLANATKRSNQVAVGDRVAVLILQCREESVYPDRCIQCQFLLIE